MQKLKGDFKGLKFHKKINNGLAIVTYIDASF